MEAIAVARTAITRITSRTRITKRARRTTTIETPNASKPVRASSQHAKRPLLPHTRGGTRALLYCRGQYLTRTRGGSASQTAGPGHVILSQEPSALGKIGPFHITSLSRYTPTQGEGVARCTRNHHPGREGGIQRTTGRLRVSEAEHTDRHNAGARGCAIGTRRSLTDDTHQARHASHARQEPEHTGAASRRTPNKRKSAARSDVVRHTHGNSRTRGTAAQRGGTTRNPTVEDNTAHTRGGGGASQTAGPGHVILSQEPSAQHCVD